jgi:mono/diheme cytochrome c family protein
LARRDIIENVATDYSLFFDLHGNPADRPTRLLTDLLAGTVDVATPWGPLAGYFAKKLHAPLDLVPLEGDAQVPLAFDISMGVKKGNQALKSQLDGVIDRRQADIRAILEDYGVPLMPAHQTPAAASGAQAPAGASGAQAPAGAGGAQATSSAPRKNPFKAANASVVAEGKMLFFENGCSGCHGAGGGGGMGPSVIDDDWKFGSNDDVLYRLIKGQIPDQTMPTVYSALSDDEVWKMLTYVRSIYIGDRSKIDW